MARQEQVELTKLRYVLYARKSTEDDSRQVRSIDDQINDCRKLQNELGLKVIEVIKESKSAKKPGQRPEFDRMLKGIRSKKYDAILCWHPDRLSRNMLESGTVIDMLDEHVLKDIRFHSHQFSNDANGKMLLGMLFVFSKQYSDDLSDKVNRGVSGNLEEGISGGTPKLGYTRNEMTGYYEPNEFFDAIQEAWLRRANGESLKTLTAYLLEKNVHRITKNLRKQRKIIPTQSTVSNMFHDPFYYGTLLQSGQSVNLLEFTNFKPMINEDTYNQVQAVGYGRTKDHSPLKRVTFYPLHGFVYCAVCSSPSYMKVGRNTTGSGKRVLTYRCDNKDCKRSPRSLRAKNVFEPMYAMLDGLQITDKVYERYSREIDSHTDAKIVEISQTVHSKNGVLSHITKEVNDRALSIGMLDKDSPAYKPNMKRLDELAIQQTELRIQIEELEAKLANRNKVKLNKEEFLNLVKTVSDKMKAGSAVEKDALCRILFLNLRVDNEKVVDYLWNEPFASLVKAREIQVGGGGWS